MERNIELLLPAGSPEVLRVAVSYGADAVYIGGESFSLRANAKNFTLKEMDEGISFAHREGAKVYVTVNIIAHNDDLKEAEVYLKELADIKPDALIIADPAIFMLARDICPGTDIHISTQSNNTNYGTFNFWHDLGAKRVVAGRELSLKEIKQIRENTPADLEIETFVHGAMCISYSGRCLLSSYMTGREGNLGQCTHPCRWRYFLMEETRPGEYFPVYENERGSYIMNSKDLCMIEHIPELIESGISSFKIEGRMKTALYAASAARTYRKAIDDFLRSEDEYRDNLEWYKEQIRACTYRDYTTGFFFGKPSESDQIYAGSTYLKPYVYLGTVEEVFDDGTFSISQKNKFSVGETIEVMKKTGENIKAKVLCIEDEEGNKMLSAPHPKQKLHVALKEAADGKKRSCLNKNSGTYPSISGTMSTGDENTAEGGRCICPEKTIIPETLDILRRKEEG